MGSTTTSCKVALCTEPTTIIAFENEVQEGRDGQRVISQDRWLSLKKKKLTYQIIH